MAEFLGIPYFDEKRVIILGAFFDIIFVQFTANFHHFKVQKMITFLVTFLS